MAPATTSSDSTAMDDPARSPWNRTVLIVAPPLLVATTWLAFNGFVALVGFQVGYLLGFLFKWVFWCLLVPSWLLGFDGLWRMFRPTHPRVGRPVWLGWLLLVLHDGDGGMGQDAREGVSVRHEKRSSATYGVTVVSTWGPEQTWHPPRS